ncbi:MAG: RNA-binding protein [Bdellovibrionaceae bacterium]|nr:RNA-binding protein [Pseudobdellovibrionaceae bacterium]
MGSKLYVGNLPFSATEDYLTNTFSECGMVESVKLVMDQDSGQSKGFALVEMSNGSEAQAVIVKFNGSECDGREMKISEAKPMKKRSFNGGRTKKAW